MTMRTENKLEESFSHGERSTKKNTVKQNVAKDKVIPKQQPHPEQLRIAQILDNAKSEDPKLKEKLKQVMEATQKSMDEAFVALHDSDYDPNRAVNLLLEGCEAEWSTSSKKKKTKSPCATQEQGKKEETPKLEVEDGHCESLGSKPSQGNRGGNMRGRGRGSYQGGRNSSNVQQDQNNYRRKNSAVKGDDDATPAIIETRYFERARTPVVRPVDTWDPSRPVSSLLNKGGSHHDEEEEEYTGSLARSLVITSSCFGKNPHQNSPNVSDEKCKSEHEKKMPVNIPQSPSQERVDCSPVDVKSPLSNNENSSKPIIGTRAPPITASIIKAPPRIDKPPIVSAKSSSSTLSLEKHSEIPTMPVVMPPDCNSSIRLLDITFGSIELEEKDSDGLQCADQSLPQKTPSPKNKVPENTLTKSDRKVMKDAVLELNNSESQQRVTDSSKSETINYYEPSICHSSYPRNTPKPRNIQSSSFPSDSLCSPSNIVYSSNVSSTYSSSPTIQASSACPPIHYNSYTTQATQSHPVIQTIPNHYQNVLGSQTYTSNSQYGTSILPTSSFSVPYPSYSSMVQQSQKQQTTSSPFTKELEVSPSGLINSMSYSGVTNSSLTSNPLPATKASATLPPALGKNNVMSNMPALVAPHQIILGQGGMPYFQQPVYFQDLHLMQQQRLPTHLNPGYYDVNYSSGGRDGASYHMNDKMFPLVQHSSHPGTATSEHVNSNIVYGENFPGHYAGICVSGHEANSGRTDNYKSSMHTPLNQPVLTAVKPVVSASKIGSYE